MVYEIQPDRPNIRLYSHRVSAGAESLDWLIYLLHEHQRNCPKTIVYCRTLKDCSTVYLEFLSGIGSQESEPDKRLFDMVHSKTSVDVKDHVISSLVVADALPRVVIATKVIGMGLDVQCDMVVHYGPPSSMDDYIQQIGRAGRDGSQAHAILLYSGKQLRNLDASVLELAKNPTNTCLRTLLLKDFNLTEESHFEQKHLCCNVCANQCSCGSCSDSYNLYEKFADQASDEEKDEEETNLFQRQIHDEDAGIPEG